MAKDIPPQDEALEEEQHLSADEQVDELPESPAEPTPDPQPEPQPGIRDLVGQYGIDTTQFEDDNSVVQYLADRAKAADQQSELAKYGQEYIRSLQDGSYHEYQQWKAEQQKQQQSENKDLLWRSDWNPAWEALLTVDEQGNVVPDTSKGGTPDLVQKYHQYQQHQRDVLRKFITDPENTLDPYVQTRAEQIARKIVQEEMSKFGEEVDARHFVLSNDWIYDRDESGKRVLSEKGKFFRDTYQQLSEDEDYSGMSAKGREKLAMRMLEEHFAAKEAATPPKPTREEKKTSFLENAAGYTPSPAASENQAPDADGVAPPQNGNSSYREQLLAAFKAEGLDDKAIAEQMAV